MIIRNSRFTVDAKNMMMKLPILPCARKLES